MNPQYSPLTQMLQREVLLLCVYIKVGVKVEIDAEGF